MVILLKKVMAMFKKKRGFIVVASAAMDYWAAILAVCRRFGNRRFHYARLRFVSPQEHLFPHCFGTFAISSFAFHFVLRENNFNTASRKMTNAHILQQKYRPWFELPDNSVPRIHKVQYRNQPYRIETVRHMHAPPKPQNWAYSRLKNKWTAETYLEIFMILFAPPPPPPPFFVVCFVLFFVYFFVCWNSRHTKYAQIVRVNRSAYLCKYMYLNMYTSIIYLYQRLPYIHVNMCT